MKDPNCIFCKIANGLIESDTIYEDEDFRVVMDSSPATKGHALVLPKEHFPDLFRMDDATAEKLMKVVRKAGTAMMMSLDCAGLNVLQNNGIAAGQTVDHYHVHLIPRYGDSEELIMWNPMKMSEGARKQLAAQIAGAVRAIDADAAKG